MFEMLKYLMILRITITLKTIKTKKKKMNLGNL